MRNIEEKFSANKTAVTENLSFRNQAERFTDWKNISILENVIKRREENAEEQDDFFDKVKRV